VGAFVSLPGYVIPSSERFEAARSPQSKRPLSPATFKSGVTEAGLAVPAH
jgi:hypothetical protein